MKLFHKNKINTKESLNACLIFIKLQAVFKIYIYLKK